MCEAKVAELRNALIVQQTIVHLPTNQYTLSLDVLCSDDDQGQGPGGELTLMSRWTTPWACR